MTILIREDLRELASHWAYVLVEDWRLNAEGIERVIVALRKESEVFMARNSPEHGHGPIRQRKRQPDTTVEADE